MSISKRDVVIGFAAAVLGALAVYLVRHFAAESPILVRDGGSMVLESEGSDTLAGRFEVDGDKLNQKLDGSMDTITGTAANGTQVSASCIEGSRCTLVVTYSDTSRLEFKSLSNGKKLFVRSREKPFAGKWDTTSSPTIWHTTNDPASKIFSATVDGTTHDGILCAGEGCSVRVTFKD